MQCQTWPLWLGDQALFYCCVVCSCMISLLLYLLHHEIDTWLWKCSPVYSIWEEKQLLVGPEPGTAKKYLLVKEKFHFLVVPSTLCLAFLQQTKPRSLLVFFFFFLIQDLFLNVCCGLPCCCLPWAMRTCSYSRFCWVWGYVLFFWFSEFIYQIILTAPTLLHL